MGTGLQKRCSTPPHPYSRQLSQDFDQQQIGSLNHLMASVPRILLFDHLPMADTRWSHLLIKGTHLRNTRVYRNSYESQLSVDCQIGRSE